MPSLTVRTAMGWTRATFESEAILSAPFLDGDDGAGEAGGLNAGDARPHPKWSPGTDSRWFRALRRASGCAMT